MKKKRIDSYHGHPVIKEGKILKFWPPPKPLGKASDTQTLNMAKSIVAANVQSALGRNPTSKDVLNTGSRIDFVKGSHGSGHPAVDLGIDVSGQALDARHVVADNGIHQPAGLDLAVPSTAPICQCSHQPLPWCSLPMVSHQLFVAWMEDS